MLYLVTLFVIATGQNYVVHSREEGRIMTRWEFSAAKGRCKKKCKWMCGWSKNWPGHVSGMAVHSMMPSCVERCNQYTSEGEDHFKCTEDRRSAERGGALPKICSSMSAVASYRNQTNNVGRFQNNSDFCTEDRELCSNSCYSDCEGMFDRVNLCTRSTPEFSFPIHRSRAEELFKTDFCKFLAEIAIAPRYRKPVATSKYVYRRGSVLPRSGIKPDDPAWGHVVMPASCDDPTNQTCYPRRNVSEFVEESLHDWFYQPCHEELYCHLPSHAPPNRHEDLSNFLSNGVGKRCKASGQVGDCSNKCFQVCEDACECHFGDARYDAYAEGRGSEYQWSMYELDLNFTCYERQKYGPKKQV